MLGLQGSKMEKFTIEEIENYLENLGYSVIKTEELERLETIVLNHPG